MSTQKTFDGLTAAFGAAVLNCLPRNMTAGQMSDYIAKPKKLQTALAAGFKTIVASAVAATFVTATYFQTSDKLHVWPEFASRITAAYSEPIAKRGLDGVEKALDLTRNMSDTEIISQLGGEAEVRKYAFTPDQIADMIDAQPSGSPGAMLTNGYANIFYVTGVDGVLFAVRVRWLSGRRQWLVAACRLGVDGDWLAGRRVFRNTVHSVT